ncbi:MAG: hypothetical protein KBG15_08890 [Kofleriaceae bacterium]|nr:hypothetical protein [Kofleriaceae bacterium]
MVLITLLTAIEAARAGTPREFLPEAQLLLANGACGSPAQGPAPVLKLVAAHCKVVTAAQVDYREKWLAVAKPFFAEHVPATIPKTVVYPFAGGDLATALTVFPDADEITTLSLEPAGDPRGLAGLRPSALKKALATAATELSSLYRHNYSVTLNMVGAMRGSTISTQLLFGLSALWVHGHELVGMRYFTLSETGELEYFDEAAIAAIDAQNLSTGKRNAAFGNVELRFRKQGSTHEQIYRHIQANLDDAHIKKSGSVLKHLEKKGKVAGMTKAASYLLTFNDFAQVRNYLIDNVQWMVSDSTGIGPKFGTPAGFVYETYGKFDATNMPAGNAITPFWKTIYKAQPARKLPFRFGYPDRKNSNHLIIMRRA